MFVSHPQNEFWNPLFVGATGSRQWRALELSTCLPWFILTLQAGEEGHEVERTVLVSWDLDLVGLVQGVAAPQLLGLLYIDPSSLQAWPIQDVWRHEDPAGEEADIFVFSTPDGQEFCGTGGRSTPRTAADR